MSIDSQNREMPLAWDFVRHTDKHVFLTGRAGTGKTTFLHNLSKNCPKRMIVTAPTGVAAINAGGVIQSIKPKTVTDVSGLKCYCKSN